MGLRSGGTLRIVIGVNLRFTPDRTARPAALSLPGGLSPPHRWFIAVIDLRPDNQGAILSSSHAPGGAEGVSGAHRVNGVAVRDGGKPQGPPGRSRLSALGRSRLSSRPGIALAIMLSAQLMIILDMTVVNIALPHIQSNLHFSATSLSWVLNGYTLTSAACCCLGAGPATSWAGGGCSSQGSPCSPSPRWPEGSRTRRACCSRRAHCRAWAVRWPRPAGP